jgi:type IV pilus assembly protein PilW
VSAPFQARASRGFTLLELAIGLGLSAIVIAAAVTLLIQQQRSYTVSATDRAHQEAGQAALREIGYRLRLAGYGVDPNLVFDFGPQALPVPRTGAPTNAVVFDAASTYRCATAVTCRDSTAGSDEVVFLSRNPLFSRTVTTFAGTTLIFRGGLTRPIYRGQILQVSCLGGSQARGYVTVANTVLPSAPAPDPAELVTITLQPEAMAGLARVFPFENSVSSDTCWGLTAAGEAPVVTQVDRYRFYLEWFSPAGAVVAAQTPEARPYLMLDQGLTDENGAPITLPVAPDVEDLQLSYYFLPPAAGLANRLVGAESGTAASAESFPLSVADAAPAYLEAPDAPSRRTGHPTNILAVRVAVVIRSAEQDLSAATLPDRTLPAVGNRPPLVGLTNYRRTLFENTVLIRNLRSTAYPYPQVDPAQVDGFNVGGG